MSCRPRIFIVKKTVFRKREKVIEGIIDLLRNEVEVVFLEEYL